MAKFISLPGNFLVLMVCWFSYGSTFCKWVKENLKIFNFSNGKTMNFSHFFTFNFKKLQGKATTRKPNFFSFFDKNWEKNRDFFHSIVAIVNDSHIISSKTSHNS